MPSDPILPPYSERPSALPEEPVPSPPTTTPRAGIAGNVQTCSIKDLQVDYLKIVRESVTSYSISLTVDPTPLYRVEFMDDSNKAGDIQIFSASASDTALPAIAAARLLPESKSKKDPIGMICTSKPHLPDARWRPVTIQRGVMALDTDYSTSIPVVQVPGTRARIQNFSWRTNICKPFFQLWWEGPLVYLPPISYIRDKRDLQYLLATVARKSAETGQLDNVVEIRRGGGLAFELSVILEMFVILHHKKQGLV